MDVKLFGKWSYGEVEVRGGRHAGPSCMRQTVGVAWGPVRHVRPMLQSFQASGACQPAHGVPRRARAAMMPAGQGGAFSRAAEPGGRTLRSPPQRAARRAPHQELHKRRGRHPCRHPAHASPPLAAHCYICLQVNDISLEDYIAVKPKYARFTNHSAGRFQKRRFRKAQCPIVERCALAAARRRRPTATTAKAVADRGRQPCRGTAASQLGLESAGCAYRSACRQAGSRRSLFLPSFTHRLPLPRCARPAPSPARPPARPPAAG